MQFPISATCLAMALVSVALHVAGKIVTAPLVLPLPCSTARAAELHENYKYISRSVLFINSH